MKKITIVGTVLLAGLFVNASSVHADKNDTTTQKNREASVELGTSDPSKLLTIVEASDLNFGSQEVTADDLFYTEDNKPLLTIQDIRGAASGWNVTVSLGEFVQTNAATGATPEKLKGVQLFYPLPTFTTVATAINPEERKPSGIQNDVEQSFTDTNVKGVLLNASQTPADKVLLNAVATKGNGKWTATYGEDNMNKIELRVPAGNLAGKYTAALTYKLVDAPMK